MILHETLYSFFLHLLYLIFFPLPIHLFSPPSSSVLPLLLLFRGRRGHKPSSLALGHLKDLGLSHGRDGILATVVVVGELLQDELPPLLLLEFVNAGRDKWDQTAPPHAGPARHDGGGERWARVVDELPWRVQALAPVAEEARSIGLCVEVEEECPKYNGQTAVEHVKAVL